MESTLAFTDALVEVTNSVFFGILKQYEQDRMSESVELTLWDDNDPNLLRRSNPAGGKPLKEGRPSLHPFKINKAIFKVNTLSAQATKILEDMRNAKDGEVQGILDPKVTIATLEGKTSRPEKRIPREAAIPNETIRNSLKHLVDDIKVNELVEHCELVIAQHLVSLYTDSPTRHKLFWLRRSGSCFTLSFPTQSHNASPESPA
ncbi:hypothetical protein HKX48_008327 [Thoreauomyces humboldtii]|nr:hypothetical protein HKX48_008327 [Thoreauomyces humboldtii]